MKTPSNNQKLNLKFIIKYVASQNINNIFIESGPNLLSSLIAINKGTKQNQESQLNPKGYCANPIHTADIQILYILLKENIIYHNSIKTVSG